jgi:hypothetical protein
MPSKICTKCDERKPLSEFPREKESKSGVGSRCLECKREAAKEQIECDRCGKWIRRDSLYRHRKTERCRNFDSVDPDRPWKQFKSNGDKMVQCPCDYCVQFDLEQIERTAYRHLKLGYNYESPAAKKRREAERKLSRKAMQKIISTALKE